MMIQNLQNHTSHIKYTEEYTCPEYSPVNVDEIALLMKAKYGLYLHTGWCYVSCLSATISSAEMHQQNKSKMVNAQLEGLKMGLQTEKAVLRLYGLVVEVLNYYDARWYYVHLYIQDKTTKKTSNLCSKIRISILDLKIQSSSST